jgi:hypothetical protein
MEQTPLEPEIQAIPEPKPNPDIYYVYPDDDGSDRFQNPYSQH